MRLSRNWIPASGIEVKEFLAGMFRMFEALVWCQYDISLRKLPIHQYISDSQHDKHRHHSNSTQSQTLRQTLAIITKRTLDVRSSSMHSAPSSPLERERISYKPVVPACLTGERTVLTYYESLQSGDEVRVAPKAKQTGIRGAGTSTGDGSSFAQDAGGGRLMDISEFFPATHALPM